MVGSDQYGHHPRRLLIILANFLMCTTDYRDKVIQLHIYIVLRKTQTIIYPDVIVINQLPRFVCNMEAQIPRVKPEG